MSSRSFLGSRFLRGLIGLSIGLFVAACDKSTSGGDAGSNACGVDCGANAVCNPTAVGGPTCECDLGYSDRSGICTANTCPSTCGSNAYCAASETCICRPGFMGDPLAGCTTAVATTSCAPFNPCLNGGTCTESGGGYTCACANGASGTNCEVPGSGSCGSYTDVNYAMTARFEIGATPFGAGDQAFQGLSANATTPPFGLANDGDVPAPATTNTTPFARPPAGSPTFTQGFARLRFVNDGSGHPIAGTVRLVEWYVPLEFTQTKGATVYANTDHSVGIIDATLPQCGAGGTTCTNHTPALARTCQPNARGLLSGQTLTWDSCTPVPSGQTSWNYTSVASVTGAGCATSYNAYGNTHSSSGLVPPTGKGDAYRTWNQALSAFVFSGTDPETASFTMAAMQIPNGTGQSVTTLSITAATVVGTECGSTIGVTLTCDEQ